MATVIRDPNGRKRIQFAIGDERKTIRLGKVEVRHAEQVRVKVEALLSATITRSPIDKETSEWLADIDDALHERLAAVGLVKERSGRGLGAWLESFMASRAELKPGSRRKLEQTQEKLLDAFGKDRAIHTITPEDAAAWRESLKGKGLSEASVKTHCGNAKTIFREAVRNEVLSRSPFAHLKGGVTPTKNTRFVTAEETEALLAACPNAEWRLLVGLARLAGLRTPSETHLLCWADVDFDKARLRVRSPKTERHPGHEHRIVPIDPRLMRLLQERYDAAGEGETLLVEVGANRRTLSAIAERAGVPAWADVWQTLRRSCEIEWAQTFPQYAVSRWIGHSITVSGRHYANSIPDELFDKVAKREAAQNAAQPPAESSVLERTSVRVESVNAERMSTPDNGMRSQSDESANDQKWSRGELNPRAVTVRWSPLRV